LGVLEVLPDEIFTMLEVDVEETSGVAVNLIKYTKLYTVGDLARNLIVARDDGTIEILQFELNNPHL